MFEPEQAKGEFFIVNLRVTNIGDDARSFSGSSQHLIINGNKNDATSSISDENWMRTSTPASASKRRNFRHPHPVRRLKDNRVPRLGVLWAGALLAL